MDSRPRFGIDLHIHTSASDGTYSPGEVVEAARRLGIKAVSITDHDTLDGIRSVEHLRPPAPKLLSGVEISTENPLGKAQSDSLHILGYGVRTGDTALNRLLGDLQASRRRRSPRILARLKDLGYPLPEDEEHATAAPGRPQIARKMITAGYVQSIDEAFHRFLGKGRPAYVSKTRADFREAIQTIQGAGGLAVLAHPGVTTPSCGEAFTAFVKTLVDMGLSGIEAYYPAHSPAAQAYYLQIARNFDLVPTGGTDFHGAIKPEIRLGCGRGDFFVPVSIYDNLVKRLKERDR